VQLTTKYKIKLKSKSA